MPALLVGLVLRTYRLPAQLLTGDEWHAFHRAMHLGYPELLTSFGISDHSLGLALYFRVAMDTVGLSDVVLRAPFLLSGLFTLLLIPWGVRKELGGFVSCALAWLLALSPLLVFFSRCARPYSLTLLCAWGGVLSFREWWNTGRHRWALAFWACSAVAGCLLVITLPFMLGVFAFALFDTIGCRRAAPLPGLRELVWLGFATAATLAALMLPALITDFWSLSGLPPGPVARRGFTADEAMGAFQVLSGDGGAAASWAVGLLVCLGTVRARRQAPRLTAFLLTLSSLHVAAIYLALPAGIAWRVVLARYLLPVLPLLLLLVATGIEALATVALAGRPVLRVGLAAALAAGLFLSGPAPQALLGPVNWVGQQLYVALWYGRDGYPKTIRRVPRFYHAMGRLPPESLTLVEVPSFIFSVSNPLAFYQSVHHQRSLIGFHNGLCGRLRKGEVPWGRRGIELRNYVFLAEPTTLTRAGASHVVFHRRLSRETTSQPMIVDQPDLSDCIAAYRSRFGAATYEDEDIVVFDLRGGGHEPAPSSQSAMPPGAS